MPPLREDHRGFHGENANNAILTKYHWFDGKTQKSGKMGWFEWGNHWFEMGKHIGKKESMRDVPD